MCVCVYEYVYIITQVNPNPQVNPILRTIGVENTKVLLSSKILGFNIMRVAGHQDGLYRKETYGKNIDFLVSYHQEFVPIKHFTVFFENNIFTVRLLHMWFFTSFFSKDSLFGCQCLII